MLHWLGQCSKIAAGKPATNMLRSSILLYTAGLRPAKHNEGEFGLWFAGRMLQITYLETVIPLFC